MIIAPNLALESNDLFLENFSYPFPVLADTPASYILIF